MRKILIVIGIVTFCVACKKNERTLVVSKIQQAAKLATTEVTIDKVVFGTSDKRILGIVRLNQARFAAYSTAHIKSGIDLNKLKPSDIIVQEKSIQITLPYVEVINFSYPFEEFKIDESITDSRKFLNKIDIFDQEDFYRQAESDIRNNLPYTGIIKATEDKTRLLLTGLLKNLGYEEIYITFQQGPLIPTLDLTDGDV